LGVVLIAIALVGYAGICATLYLQQRSMLYFPTPESKSTRAQALSIATDGAVLKVWRLPGASDRALIYFGGNGDDVAANIAPFARAFPGVTIYLVNYRGYGGSTGTPSEAALLADGPRACSTACARSTSASRCSAAAWAAASRYILRRCAT